jgi:hypothetical protein
VQEESSVGIHEITFLSSGIVKDPYADRSVGIVEMKRPVLKVGPYAEPYDALTLEQQG